MRYFSLITRILAMGLLLVFSGGLGAQQVYPDKPIRFITPYPPGGSTTFLSRLVGVKLTEAWGQQVVVDNRGGGNTIIGVQELLNSAPDGYTIFLAGSAQTGLPHLYRELPFDVMKDLAPVATIAISPQLLTINTSIPAKDLKEFIAYAKAKSGALNFATSSVGGPTHLAAVQFQMLTGAKLQHVPYKGAGPVLVDLIGGRVQVFFSVPVNVLTHIKAGRLKGLAITGKHRMETLPEVPTFTEAGLPGLDVETWYGIAAPAGTSKNIVAKLSGEVRKILAMPDIKEKLESQGMVPLISTSEQMSAMMREEMAKQGALIKAGQIAIN
jgi:tripartite-type tricarboxylate transporter receptor subunit TctC